MNNWKQSPFVQGFLAPFKPFIKMYYHSKWNHEWKLYLKKYNKIQLNIGASVTRYKGWFPTDIGITDFYFDVTDEKCYQKITEEIKISKVLAEHVFEHLTTEQIEKALPFLYQYSTKDVNIRIAVPDGFHIDKNYIEQVKINGKGKGADDHKQLFTYQSLSTLFEKAGFKSYPIEYWDENGVFHQGYQNDENGYVKRSMLNDERNANGKPNYTSLIIDFKKY
jgi:predicted SAM-dependent methyltransferase